MFVVGNFFISLAGLFVRLLDLYMWAFVISALLSWVQPDPYNPIVRFLYQITEPVLDKIRRVLPISGMGLDFSPIIAIFAILFLSEFIKSNIK